MKRSMRVLTEANRRPAHWRWVQMRYHARGREGKLAVRLESYRIIMELHARQQREFVRVR